MIQFLYFHGKYFGLLEVNLLVEFFYYYNKWKKTALKKFFLHLRKIFYVLKMKIKKSNVKQLHCINERKFYREVYLWGLRKVAIKLYNAVALKAVKRTDAPCLWSEAPRLVRFLPNYVVNFGLRSESSQRKVRNPLRYYISLWRNPVLFSKKKNRQKTSKIMRISIFRTLEFRFIFVHGWWIRGQILAPRLS